MERNRRTMLTGLAVTGVLAGALAGGGAALASTVGAPQPAAVAAVGSTAPAANAAASTANAAASTANAATPGKGGVRFLRRAHAARLVLRTAAAYLGLSPSQLRAQLRAGKSLAAVATARGKSVSGLEGAILAAAVKRIDASKLTAARKAAVISDVKSNLSAFVSATHPFEKAARRLGKATAAAASVATQPAV